MKGHVRTVSMSVYLLIVGPENIGNTFIGKTFKLYNSNCYGKRFFGEF